MIAITFPFFAGEALALARDMEAEVGRSFPKKHLIASIVNGTTRHGIDERQHGFASARYCSVHIRDF